MSTIGDVTAAEWLDTKDYPFLSRHVQVDGGRMHYVDEGQGEPILFVHGFPTWSFMWRGLIKDLSLKHRCIAMDHIGFGLSDKPDHWSYTPEAHARNLRKLLEHLGISTFSLVVHDFGGPIALSYALDYPGRIKRISVLNSFMWSLKTDERVVKFDHKMHGPLGKLGLQATGLGLNNMIHGMIAQRQKVPAKVYGQYTGPFHKAVERNGPMTLARSYIGSSAWLYDLWVRREAIAKIPGQILWGMKDRLLGPEHLNRWRHLWPNADFVTFPESGALIVEEQARDVEAAVYMFMDGQLELQGVQKAIHAEF